MRHIITVLSLFLVPVFAAADVQKRVNPTSGLFQWKTGEQDFSLELVQVSADYVRAVFSARGLPQDVVEDISRYCVFGTIIKNRSDTEVSYRLSDWEVLSTDGTERKFKLKSEWINEWRSKGVGFRWLMLADEQAFDEGDWIQGFTSLGLAPGGSFDLKYSWRQRGKTHHREIKGMQCAPVKPSKP